MVIKILQKDRFYIPIGAVDKQALITHCEVKYATKEGCHKGCPLASKQHRYCSTCPSKDNRVKMWEKIITPAGRKLIAIPGGNSTLLDKVVVGKYKLVDRRITKPFRSELKWTGKLRRGEVNSRGEKSPNQKMMLMAWSRMVETQTGGVVVSPPRCVTGDSLILTSRGITRIGDWAQGKPGMDESTTRLRGRKHVLNVAVESGNFVPIDGFWTSPPEKIIRVQLRGGLEVKGTFDHPIMANTGFIPLRNLKVGECVPVYYGQNVWGIYPDLSEDVAKFIGFWVAEGSSSAHGKIVHVTNYDTEVRDLCRKVMLSLSPRAKIKERARDGFDPELGFKRCIGSRDYNLYKKVNALVDGLWRKSSQKVIPRKILESPKNIVCAFLQALFEGDGYVYVARRYVSYCSISRMLVKQLQVVLNNLGIISKMRKRWTWATNGTENQVSKPCWSIVIKGPDLMKFKTEIGFFSYRKKSLLDEAIAYNNSLGVHQPLWYHFYPEQIKNEYLELIDEINQEWSKFRIGGGWNRLSSYNVSYASQVTGRAKDRLEKRRLGSNNRALTRARLLRHWGNLKESRHWMDLSIALRTKVTMFFEKYLNTNCYWTSVSRIRVSTKKHVTYDVSVPHHHRFMANGILNHNTGKCVTAGTMILTDQGYMFIEDLFGSIAVEDSIGSFGRIAVPNEITEIKGLHCRQADGLVKLHFANGVKLTCTPEHPIVVMHKGKQVWLPAKTLSVHTEVVLHPVVSPVPDEQGLTPDEAELMGHITSCADLMALRTGLVQFEDAFYDYSEAEDLERLLSSVLGIQLKANLTLHLENFSRLRYWNTELLKSPDATWRAFVKGCFASNFSKTPSVMLTQIIARALHFHLTGWGVEATLHQEPFGHVVVIKNTLDLRLYLSGKRPLKGRDGLTTTIKKIEYIPGVCFVYDLMVPKTHAFITDGVTSHNTVIGVAGVMLKRQRALITASKIDFLRQFGRRFGELTNLRQLYRQGKRPVVLIDPSGWKDGKSYGVHVLKKWMPEVGKADVILSTYQQFVSEEHGAARLIKHLNGKIGLVVGDEIHQAATRCFSKIMNRLNTRYKMGLTATTVRKDGLDKIVEAVMGRTAVVGTVTSTLPRLELLETGVTTKTNYKLWAYMEAFLAKHEERNRMIMRQVFKDLREDKKHFVLIPVTRIAHNHALVKMINAQAEFNRKNKGEDWPVDLAVSFRGGKDNNEIMNQVDAGRARVVVATFSMVKYGLDVQRWTHAIVGAIPTSNAANIYQLLNRVCTPYTPELEAKIGRKPQPVVRFIIDEMSASVFCFAKLFNDINYGLKAALNGKNFFNAVLAKANPDVVKRMSDIARFPRAYSASDAGVTKTYAKSKSGVQQKSAWKTRLSGVKRF